MKRSQINDILRSAKGVLESYRIRLPVWAYWPPAAWDQVGPEAREIRDAMLGWDITDFGSGDFPRVGLLLFTLRNASLKGKGNAKSYAEKIMLVEPHQITPMHFHWTKMEDIINRGGGELVLWLYRSLPDEDLDRQSDVQVAVDGITRTVPAGGTVRLAPGESITLTPGLYHEFWAENGRCVVGEVSMVNDDTKDNRFHQPVGRFPVIDEDEPPLHLLCGDLAQRP
jgi:D-lyxose ketol-isomerase